MNDALCVGLSGERMNEQGKVNIMGENPQIGLQVRGVEKSGLVQTQSIDRGCQI